MTVGSRSPSCCVLGGRGGHPFRDHRQVVKGIVYRFRTSIAWRNLHEEFGPWQTGWKRHRRFSLDGTRDRLLTRLLAEAHAAGEVVWAVSMDSTSTALTSTP